MRGLDGKVVVVAGGAGGIGTATSLRLAAEGARVVVGDLDGDAATSVAGRITEQGGRAVAVQVDVSDDDAVRAMIDAALSSFGGLDGLHANAADLSPGNIGSDSDAVAVPLETFDHTLDVNLRGHLLCTRHAIPHLLDRGGGALAYTASVAAFIGEPARPSYAMAKAGICALVRHVASKWGHDGVRANAVAPGLVLTPQLQAAIPEVAEASRRRSRSHRLGTPEDIAAAIAFLLSDDGGWINGQVLAVDGGTTMRP